MPRKTPAGRAQLLLDAVAVILASAIAVTLVITREDVVQALPAGDRAEAAEFARRQLLALNTANLNDPAERQRVGEALGPRELQSRLFGEGPFGHPRDRLTGARVSTLVVTGSSRTPKPMVGLMAVVRGKVGGVDTVRRYNAGAIRTWHGWRMSFVNLAPTSTVMVFEGFSFSGKPTDEFRFAQETKKIMSAVLGVQSEAGETGAPDLTLLTGDARRQYDRILTRAGWTTRTLSADVRHPGIIRRDGRSAEMLMFVNLGGGNSCTLGRCGPSDSGASSRSAATDLALKVSFVRVDGAWKISRMVDA